MRTGSENRKWFTLFAMCFGLFMIMLDNTVVNVALPSIQRELDTTPSNLEWVVNAYTLSFAALILFGGKLGDRFGRKRLFIVGLAIFTVTSAWCALATTDTGLIWARAAQGVGGAIMNPLSLSILVATFPRKQLPLAIGIWAGISGLGLALGPLLGGFLVDSVGWAAVFWINVPIGFLAAAVTLMAVDESRDTSTTSIDVVGTVLITAGLFLLTFGLIETNTHSWTSPFILSLLAAAAVTIAVFVLWESRVAEPMIPLDFFRRRVFAISSIVVALVGLAMFGVIYFITLYFQNVKGYGALEAGVRSLPMTMMLMVVAPVAGRLNGTKVSPRVLMTVGMLSASAGLFGLAQLDVESSYHAIWPFYVLMGIGLALTMPAVSTAGMSAVHPSKAGIASGVINAARQTGGALGIAILGAVGARLTTSSWSDTAGALPDALRTRSGELEELVVGARGAEIGQLAGPGAREAALTAFVDGVQGAMYVGGGLTLLAAAFAAVGLAGLRGQVQPPGREPVAVPAEV